VLERVNGELADLLTGGSGSERVLQNLEEANAFVVSLDVARSWFRYHHLFAGLLRLELRGTEPKEITTLHQLAAGWFAGHGYQADAVRHAQSAQDWGLAARLLADHWPGLYLGGQEATVHALLAGFPAEARADDAELAAVAAADELAEGSLEAAELYLGLAERGSASVPEGRRGQAQVLLGVVQLLLARQQGNLPAVAEQAQRLQALAATPHAAREMALPGLGDELRALALVKIGDLQTWTGRLDQAESHLEQGVALARRIGRPYLEFMGLVDRAEIHLNRPSFPRAAEGSRQAIELAERHGWTDDPAACTAFMTLGAALAWQGRLDEAEAWMQRAERIFRAEANPAVVMGGQYVRGQLELGRGRVADALAAFRTAERLAGPHPLARPLRAWLVHTLVRLGEIEDAEQVLAGLSEGDRDRGDMRIALAALRLAQHDPRAVTAVLKPVLDGSVSFDWAPWAAQAFVLEAIALDALGETTAAGRALERALELAGPDGALPLFLLYPARGLLERQAGHHPAHAAMIAESLRLLASQVTGPPAGHRPLLEPLRDSEVRVLRYLPTNLTLPEIARELRVSHNTVKTHIRSLYTQLGAHRRAEAVDRARALGLLAPAAPRR
jgi:LuxR family transcriptional regulator, maltose regulon positive regulatory protein